GLPLAERHREGTLQLVAGDVAQRHERLADAIAGERLERERFLYLVVGDEAELDEQLTERFRGGGHWCAGSVARGDGYSSVLPSGLRPGPRAGGAALSCRRLTAE